MGLDSFKKFDHKFDIKLDAIHESLNGVTLWKFGTEQHYSVLQKILGSTMLVAESDIGHNVNIRHIVVNSSSQWFIGCYATSVTSNLHVGQNAVKFFNGGSEDYNRITVRDRLSYIPLSSFKFLVKAVLR